VNEELISERKKISKRKAERERRIDFGKKEN
jgi:hypothetical protein